MAMDADQRDISRPRAAYSPPQARNQQQTESFSVDLEATATEQPHFPVVQRPSVWVERQEDGWAAILFPLLPGPLQGRHWVPRSLGKTIALPRFAHRRVPTLDQASRPDQISDDTSNSPPIEEKDNSTDIKDTTPTKSLKQINKDWFISQELNKYLFCQAFEFAEEPQRTIFAEDGEQDHQQDYEEDYEQDHEQNYEQHHEPTSEGSTRYLVCYGKGGSGLGSAFVVNLVATDPRTQWRKLRDEWVKRRGWTWLRTILAYLGYRVKEIRIAKIQIQTLPFNPEEDEFLVAYRALDTRSEIKRLSQLLEADKDLTRPYLGYSEDYAPEHACFFDPHGILQRRCNWELPEPCCNVKTYSDTMSELSGVQLQSRYADYFRNPKLAGGHSWNELPGRYDDEALRRIVDRLMYEGLHCFELQGLHLVEGWTWGSMSIVAAALAVILCAVVISSKLAYGDWATAWTVASAFGGFITVGLMWIHREWQG